MAFVIRAPPSGTRMLSETDREDADWRSVVAIAVATKVHGTG